MSDHLISSKKLIIPPTPAWPGSLGDQAILLSLDKEKCDIVACDVNERSWSDLGFEKTIDFRKINPEEYEELHIYPADVLDGAFGPGSLKYFEKASSLFADKKIFLKCFSYGSNPIKQSIDYVRRTNAVFSLRDEYSLARFRGFFPDKKCTLEPDPAFGLEPSEPSNPIDIKEMCVGVCPAKKELQKYSEIVDSLLKKNYEPMLIVHDLRKNVGDIALCDELSKRHGVPILPTQDPREVKYYVSKMNFVITGRMHVAIASLGVGTKVYGFDYNEKMKGAFKLKNQEHNIITKIKDILEIQ